MNLKVFIVCLDKEYSLHIAKSLVYKNDELSIAPTFTTNPSENIINENYKIYLDVNTVNLSYKNNALLYIKTNQYISSGITTDDFYNNDICIMNIDEYNLIPEYVFNKYDILTVWIDTKNHGSLQNSDLIEIRYFSSFIENVPYIYFLDTESNIEDTILDYIKGNEEERKCILEDNN